jgi:hypothetical protein
VTSTRVATNGAEALAGSNPIRCGTNGSIDPVSEQNMTTQVDSDRQRDQHPVLAVDGG